jgi:hypothetical protein
MVPWASFEINDLPQGADDQGRIIASALKSDLCLCILSKENLVHQWINFEAGLFYGKRADVFSVYTILIDGLSHTDLTGSITKTHPLSRIYHCLLSTNTDNLKSLLVTLYKNHHQIDGIIENIPKKISDAIDRYIASQSTQDLLAKARSAGIKIL